MVYYLSPLYSKTRSARILMRFQLSQSCVCSFRCRQGSLWWPRHDRSCQYYKLQLYFSCNVLLCVERCTRSLLQHLWTPTEPFWATLTSTSSSVLSHEYWSSTGTHRHQTYPYCISIYLCGHYMIDVCVCGCVFCRVFQADLQARLQQWGAEQCIGDVCVKLCSNLRVYTNYFNNYTTALSTIDKVESNNMFCSCYIL